MMIRLFRTEGDGGGTAAAPLTGAEAVTELLTPKPVGQVPPVSGPGTPQPVGQPPVDPAKPEAGKEAVAGSETEADRIKKIEQNLNQTRFLGKLQNENADMRRELAELKARLQGGVAPVATPHTTETQAKAQKQAEDQVGVPFDARTVRAELKADPDVKRLLDRITENQGEEVAEDKLQELILQAKIAHGKQQALIQRTEKIETENMMAAVNAEFSSRHPELADDPELQTALERIEQHYNELSENGQLDTLTVKEMFYVLAQHEYLPKIIDFKVKAGIEEGVKRELARIKAGGTVAGGGAPGSMPGGAEKPGWKGVLNID